MDCYVRWVIEEVLAHIDAPNPGEFDELARRVFTWQFEQNEPYRRFCELRGVRPEDVRSWRDAPSVPVLAFKRSTLVARPLDGDEAREGLVFRTSGTTEGRALRGIHYVPDPEVYRRAALRHFEEMVLPDGARPRLLVLAPSHEEEPEASLSRMIHWIDETFGGGGAEGFIAGGVLEEERLSERLLELEPTREPVLMIGITGAFQQFLDSCRRTGRHFRLPYASRIVDTGGSKGRGRLLSRPGLLRAFWERFGVPGYYVANEYGMTEMCSQFYDSSIRDHVLGQKRDRRKVGPAWVRTRVLDPQALTPVPDGQRGLLAHFDLANVGSVSSLRTEDVGRAMSGGFEMLGRAPGAEVRGCSLLLREVSI